MKKNLLAAVALCLLVMSAHAEILIRINKGADGRPALLFSLKATEKLWINCRGCWSYTKYIQKALIDAGHAVVDTKEEADTEIIFFLEAAVPDSGKIPFMEGDEIFDKQTPSIPPLLKAEGG